MKGKRFLSVILIIVMIIEIISPMMFQEVLAVESTNNETNSETTEETIEDQASEEQTNEEVSREYEIKEEETWDISENGDGSVIAKWTLSDKTLRISGNGEMKDWQDNNEKEDWHNSQYTNIIENVIIEDGETNIGVRAFENCTNLASIEIPESVTEIGYDAFYGCSSLRNIEIPEGVTEIGNYAFEGCNSLKSINVDANNKNYMSENGILFNKDKTKLIRFPAQKDDIKEYQIPICVSIIGETAFEGCSSLTAIDIPEGVTYIGSYAFSGCSSLTGIEIFRM